MANRHSFAANVEFVNKTAPFSGQALIVWNEVKSSDIPREAETINNEIVKKGGFKTKQDSLRVTLYYLIVLSNKGWIIKHRPNNRAVEAVNAFADIFDKEGELI